MLAFHPLYNAFIRCVTLTHPHPYPFILEEVQLSGNGNVRTVVMPVSSGICYFTTLDALYRNKEGCSLDAGRYLDVVGTGHVVTNMLGNCTL